MCAALAVPAAAASGDTVRYSASASRTAAVALSGATVSGDVFVFVPRASDITRVAFFLDGATSPFRVERYAPWDMGGTAGDGTANPVRVSVLGAGSHRIRAAITRPTGTTQVTASFTVASTPPPASKGTGSGGTPAPSDTTGTSSGSLTSSSGRPWAPTSPFNAPLPGNPVLDQNSASIAAYLSGGSPGPIASLYDYGWPVYHADANTPRVSLTTTENWGSDPFGGQPVPIPPTLQASPGTDGHAAVVDLSTGRVYEFWQLHKVDDTHWTASWGQITPDVFHGIGNEKLFGGSSKGSGTSGLGGLVRAYEMRQGHIDHALEFASDAVTPTAYRYPATKTDGANSAGQPLTATIPEGARVRLDPSIDLSAIPGITPAELIVGRALQKYGAYCTDQGGARMSVGFENPVGDPAGDPYPGLGLAWDYYAMKHLPWSHLQVLRQWDGN